MALAALDMSAFSILEILRTALVNVADISVIAEPATAVSLASAAPFAVNASAHLMMSLHLMLPCQSR